MTTSGSARTGRNSAGGVADGVKLRDLVVAMTADLLRAAVAAAEVAPETAWKFAE